MTQRSAEPRKLARRGTWLLAGLVAVLGLVAGLIWLGSGPALELTAIGPARSAGSPAVARRETRPTLDPSQFLGRAARAHQVAREIPDVLDQLYCYCECDRHYGHKSLLSCYTDGHAAT